MATSNFPSSLDTTSALPASISDTASLNSPNHADMHEVTNDAIIEIEEKLGTGDTTASAGAVLIGTGSGASAWDTTPTFVSTVTVGGVVDITDTTDSSDATGDTGALRCEGGASIAKKLYVGTDLDVDGTTNLDAVDIDGNVQLDGTFTIGANDTGYDFKLHGATVDKFLLWDESDNMLEITGVNGTNALAIHDGNLYVEDSVDIEGNIDVNGTANLDVVDIDGAVDMASTLTLAGNADLNGSVDIAGDLTLSAGSDGALRFTNAGENSIKIPDNQASALIIEEANNAYMTFTTTNSEEVVTFGKAVEFPNGSSSAPSITFDGDPDTGIYRADSDIIGFVGGLSLATALPQVSTGSYATLRRFSDGIVKELTSSVRWKKDIEDISTEEAYKVLDARPIKYRGLDDDSSAPLEAGLSAESVHDSGWTYAVGYDAGTENPRSVHYEMLVTPLIKIVKDLNTRLAALEG
jgi:cytoskeletal protein CcmA (bactofilin family)